MAWHRKEVNRLLLLPTHRRRRWNAMSRAHPISYISLDSAASRITMYYVQSLVRRAYAEVLPLIYRLSRRARSAFQCWSTWHSSSLSLVSLVSYEFILRLRLCYSSIGSCADLFTDAVLTYNNQFSTLRINRQIYCR